MAYLNLLLCALLDTTIGPSPSADLTWQGMDSSPDADLDQCAVLGQSEYHDDAIDPGKCLFDCN